MRLLIDWNNLLKRRVSTDSAEDLAFGGMSLNMLRRRRARGASLLICLFVMSLTAMILVGTMNTTTSQLTAMRNTVDYERALYLAGAAAHHALAELEADPNWSTGVPATEFPAGSGNTYSASLSSGSGTTILITGTGVSGAVTRKVQLTVDAGS